MGAVGTSMLVSTTKKAQYESKNELFPTEVRNYWGKDW